MLERFVFCRMQHFPFLVLEGHIPTAVSKSARTVRPGITPLMRAAVPVRRVQQAANALQGTNRPLSVGWVPLVQVE